MIYQFDADDYESLKEGDTLFTISLPLKENAKLKVRMGPKAFAIVASCVMRLLDLYPDLHETAIAGKKAVRVSGKRET